MEGDTCIISLKTGAVNISIHALRVEGDRGAEQSDADGEYFYPRPPGGGRRLPMRVLQGLLYFYPRPPGGGRHESFTAIPNEQNDFYPRPPGGGRPQLVPESWQQEAISIHALRVEGDRGSQGRRGRKAEFLSTPSGWRATFGRVADTCAGSNFYPRPPGGGRRTRV